MKKIKLFSLLMLFSAINLTAAPRSAEEAKILATEFFSGKKLKTRSVTTPVVLAATSLELENVSTRLSQSPAYYIYNQNQTGFVIISGDDRMDPILGYSLEQEFNKDSLPDNMRFWLTLYSLKQQTLDTETTSVITSPQRNNEQFAESVSPLLGAIQYDQGAP